MWRAKPSSRRPIAMRQDCSAWCPVARAALVHPRRIRPRPAGHRWHIRPRRPVRRRQRVGRPPRLPSQSRGLRRFRRAPSRLSAMEAARSRWRPPASNSPSRRRQPGRTGPRCRGRPPASNSPSRRRQPGIDQPGIPTAPGPAGMPRSGRWVRHNSKIVLMGV